MCAGGGGQPSGVLAGAINTCFGSYDEFKAEFKTAGATQFGSGWAWLVTDKAGKLSVLKTPNAETPITSDDVRILSLFVGLCHQRKYL
jgi:superoxide dismutase, Fe-Mn family